MGKVYPNLDCGEFGEAEEAVGCVVVSCRDAPAFPQPVNEPLDLVARGVEGTVNGVLDLTVALGRDLWGCASSANFSAYVVAVVAFVGEQGLGDEARVGQKTKITCRWARRRTRPSAPIDQRSASTSIFGAICPNEGKAVGLVLPWCNIAAMNLHLAAISADVAPRRHAALLLDQAEWHLSAKLVAPAKITFVPVPAKCPELSPQENIWQFLRDNRLSNRIFHCRDTWNKFEAQSWRVMSIGMREWAHRF